MADQTDAPTDDAQPTTDADYTAAGGRFPGQSDLEPGDYVWIDAGVVKDYSEPGDGGQQGCEVIEADEETLTVEYPHHGDTLTATIDRKHAYETDLEMWDRIVISYDSRYTADDAPRTERTATVTHVRIGRGFDGIHVETDDGTELEIAATGGVRTRGDTRRRIALNATVDEVIERERDDSTVGCLQCGFGYDGDEHDACPHCAEDDQEDDDGDDAQEGAEQADDVEAVTDGGEDVENIDTVPDTGEKINTLARCIAVAINTGNLDTALHDARDLVEELENEVGDDEEKETPDLLTDGGQDLASAECTDKLCSNDAKWALWMPHRDGFSRVVDAHECRSYDDGDLHPHVCDECLPEYKQFHGDKGDFVRPQEKLAGLEEGMVTT